jgi:predicted kinase
MAATGRPDTRLILLRGNSGSGKSSVARGLRERHGPGLAWVEQDHLRRVVLAERDRPGAANIGLIDRTVRYALDAGFHVVCEGILFTGHYGEMLRALCVEHLGTSFVYYFDVPFVETVRRHATRPGSAEFTPEQMRSWWTDDDRLGVPGEQVIPARSSLADTVGSIHAQAFAVSP